MRTNTTLIDKGAWLMQHTAIFADHKEDTRVHNRHAAQDRLEEVFGFSPDEYKPALNALQQCRVRRPVSFHKDIQDVCRDDESHDQTRYRRQRAENAEVKVVNSPNFSPPDLLPILGLT